MGSFVSFGSACRRCCDARDHAPVWNYPMSHRTLLPGRSYRFLYPSINFDCLVSGMEERRLLVERVRDTELEPLLEENLNSNPFIKRGRWLVTGIDLDKMEERSF